MNTLQQLERRFPYMFAGENIGISIARGWEDLFTHLCEDIDRLLGDDKQGFHWTQCKEKFGYARFSWTKKNRGQKKVTQTISVSDQLRALVNAATHKTQRMCIVCGQPGIVNREVPYMLVLCPDHAADRRAGRLKPTQIWGGGDEE